MAASSIEEYLATIPPEALPPLEKLRKAIRAAAPEATETISYGIPTFKHHGGLVGFGATKNHCAFYLFSGSFLEGYAKEIEGFDTSKGTIRFPFDKPLPDALVQKLVKGRIKENEARR